MAAEIIGNGPAGESDAGAGGSTPLELRNRPLHVLSGELTARLDEVEGVDAWTMNATECAETIVELQRSQARLAAAQARVLAQAERLDVAQRSNATSTAAWLRAEVPLTPRQAKDAVALAKALDTGTYPATERALATGELQVDQAHAVIDSVDALPDMLMAEERLQGEAHLVALGQTYDAKQLRRLGRHLLEVVDPEAADRAIAKQLEAEEAAAERATSFTLVDDGRGRAHGRFTIPSLHGEMLRKLLQSFANPQIPNAIPRSNGGGETENVDGDQAGKSQDGGTATVDQRRLTCEVLGDALVRLIECYPVDKVPSSGGLNASVVVTMPLETLQDGLKRATVTGTGVDISAAAARRMACAAGIIPAVLDGKSRVLDLGRRRRFASPAQRLAKLIEQQGLCAIEHCDRPASWADAHHWKKRWVDGGTTNRDDLIMICPRHHTLAHLPERTVSQVEGGGYRIHRRT